MNDSPVVAEAYLVTGPYSYLVVIKDESIKEYSQFIRKLGVIGGTPFMIEAEQAAKAIADGLRRRGFEIHFPKRFTLLLKLLRSLPYIIALRLTKTIQS